MLRDGDPIRLVRFHRIDPMPREHLARWARELETELREIERTLDTEAPRFATDYKSPGCRLDHLCRAVTGPPLQRIVSVYQRLLPVKCQGKAGVERGLLQFLVASGDAALVPLWKQVLDFVAERDPFSNVRREFAAAGLAGMARNFRSHEAWSALLEATAHRTGGVQRAAVRALGAVYEPPVPRRLPFGMSLVSSSRPGRKRTPASAVLLPAEVISALAMVAVESDDFLARFYARLILCRLGHHVPADPPNTAHLFEMSYGDRSSFKARFQVRSDQSMDRVLLAILAALSWDHDHMHAFYMSGRCWDERTQLPHGELSDGDSDLVHLDVGQLGLRKGVKFVCLYDFGDNNKLPIRCLGLVSVSEASPSYEILSQTGAPPEQYRW